MVAETSTDDLIAELRAAECLKSGDFILKSGAHSNYYIDFRESTFSRCLFRKIVLTLAAKIREILMSHPLDDVVILGVPYGVVPIAGAVAYELDCRYAPLRKEKKMHGRESDLDRLKGLRFILIEDVMSTGSSIRETIERLDGHTVTDVVVIANREAGGDESLQAKYPHIKVHSILRASDMIQPDK